MVQCLYLHHVASVKAFNFDLLSSRSILFLVIDLHLFALGARVIVYVVCLMVRLASYAENVFANGAGHPQ